MKNGEIKISACMIVKNEEEHLPRCLISSKDFIDELIIVDTGSTDKTIEIAKAFGASIYSHEWENNFSLHRNQAISYATGDWIFIIDADEELIINDKNNFKKYIENINKTKIDAIALLVQDIQGGNIVMQFNSARLFKKSCVEYRGIVHNQPKIKGEGSNFCPFINLKHYGYDLTVEQKAAKTKRTSTLLFERLKIDSSDYICYFYLAQLLATNLKHEECIKNGEKYLAHKDDLGGGFNNSIYFTCFHNYMKLADWDNAKRWLELGLKAIPDDLDINLAQLEFGVCKKESNLITQGAKNYLRIFESYQKNPSLKGNRFTYSFNPMALAFIIYHLTIIQLKEGFFNLKNLTKVLTNTPEKFKTGMLTDFQKEMNASNIPIFIESNKKESTDKKVMFNLE